MARLLIHVEGETEESFVNEVIAHHLYQCGYKSVSARLVGNARLRERRGGIRAWGSVKKDILNHLKEDRGCFATTMVDYYALPQVGDKRWPGRAEAGHLVFEEKAACVEGALLADVNQSMGEACYPPRFLPYVIMHEFEGLLFSDCKAFAKGIGRPHLVASFENVRKHFSTPEEINDSPITAPSKRVVALVEGYEKPFHGTLAILEIGLERVRQECPHFNAWLCTLEGLVR